MDQSFADARNWTVIPRWESLCPLEIIILKLNSTMSIELIKQEYENKSVLEVLIVR